MFDKKSMVLGKIIEIIILILGAYHMIFQNSLWGTFFTFLIIFDWIISPLIEKKHYNDYFYSWKAFRNSLNKNGKRKK